MHARTLVALLLFAGCDDAGKSSVVKDAGDDVVDGVVDATPTWHGDVAPLLAEHCGACHRDGGLAPFSIGTYDDATRWAAAIVDAVDDGRMPPFDAAETPECADHVPFADDRRLSDADKALLSAWVDAGTPEGDPADADPVTLPQPETIAVPDAVVALPSTYTVDGDEDRYVCFRVEVPLDQDVWLTGVEVRPDNDLVVHHVLVWNDPKDQSAALVDADGKYPCSGTPDFFPTEIVGTWTPGAGVMRPPEGAGTPLKKTGSLVVNIHYHPTGAGPELDRSEVALEWTTTKPSRYATWFLVDLPFGAETQADADGTEFRIPAGASRHVETVVLDTRNYLPIPLPVFAITPHMHYLGRDMLVTLRREGDDACLVHTPTYRFDWQTTYVYDAAIDELPTVLPGDRIEVRCTYDNSPSNPYLSKALAAAGRTEPGDVRWGEETADEMCMAMVGLLLPPIDISDLLDGFF